MTENPTVITITVPSEIDGETDEVARVAAREMHRAAVEVRTAAEGVYRQLRNAALDADLTPTAEKVAAWETSTQGLLARKLVERAEQLARSAELLSRRVHGNLPPDDYDPDERLPEGQVCEL